MKKVLALILSLTVLFAPGCWSKIEVNELAFIMCMGIDPAPDGEYVVAYQIAVPTGKGGREGKAAEARTVCLAFKAPNLREAAVQVHKTLDRAPFSGQMRLVLFSEQVARKGLAPVFDYLTRFYQLRRNVNLLVVKGKVEELFQTTPSGSEILGLNLSERIEATNKLGLLEKITVGNRQDSTGHSRGQSFAS